MYFQSCGSQMYQLHSDRAASNPMHVLDIFTYLYFFIYIYLHTNVSTYFTGTTLYYTRDKDRAFLEQNTKTITLYFKSICMLEQNELQIARFTCWGRTQSQELIIQNETITSCGLQQVLTSKFSQLSNARGLQMRYQKLKP